MKFRKFESIENTYNRKNISKILMNGYDKGQWMVTEKLHGANFSIYIDKAVVIGFGSRNQFVDGSFYDSADLQKELKEGIEKSFDGYLKNLKDAEIIIYGELVGSRIQKEVYYCDDVMFYMFDVVINGEVLNKDEARDFYRNIHEYAVCVPIIYTGTFEECVKVNNTFNSMVSRGRPNNEAEGIIIEPVITMFYNNDKRILLKNKTRKFSEKNDGVVNVVFTELSEKDNVIFNELITYLNTNRLNAVRSKSNMFGKPVAAISHLMVKDMIEDYNKDNCSSDNSLRKDCDDFKMVTRRLQLEVNKFITNGDV